MPKKGTIKENKAQSVASVAPTRDHPGRAKSVKKTEVKLSVPVYSLAGEKRKDTPLPQSVTENTAKPSLIAQAIRVYQANLRQGTVSTKTRGEVTGSTRKIYRQKGTGRARHGSIKAPIFVGGGIVFGPQPRDFSLKLPQKMRRLVALTLLGEKARTGGIKMISDLAEVAGKTKEMNQLFRKLGIAGKRLLFVTEVEMAKARLGVRNLPYVSVRTGSEVSAFDFISHEFVVFEPTSLAKFLGSPKDNAQKLT